MNIADEIINLEQMLLPPYEDSRKWPRAARVEMIKLFGVIVGMYIGTRMTAEQIKAIKESLENIKGK